MVSRKQPVSAKSTVCTSPIPKIKKPKRAKPADTDAPAWYTYFSSGCGKYHLSNFAAARVTFEGKEYPSSEHAYQARKFAEGDRHRFEVGGDLASFDAFPLFYKEPDATKKAGFWSSTYQGKRPPMVGIVAKLASHPDRAKKLGLTMRWHDESQRSEESLSSFFTDILKCKYTQNPEFYEVLKATGDTRLIEFGRDAGHKTAAGKPPLWTGLVKEDEVLGKNLMGRIMEGVRAELCPYAA